MARMSKSIRQSFLLIPICLLWPALGIRILATPLESPPDYAKYAVLLETYVDAEGLVNYAGLKEKRSALDEFLRDLATLSPQAYQSWPRRDRIALWINAYNACTLRAIIDHYPIRASFLKSLAYPKNSIRQISGVWDELQFSVMGRKLTLDQMEHEILRREFGEPRIHMALVCAALSCPPLRSEPYEGSKLKEQFRDQTQTFLGRTGNFELEGKVLYLSSIFDWFGEDFVQRYGNGGPITNHGKTESAVLNFLLPHLAPQIQEKVRSGDFRIRYSDYDWELNEQVQSLP